LPNFSLAAAQGSWPKQEIWTYRSNDRLRVAVIEGADKHRSFPGERAARLASAASYRVAAGGSLQMIVSTVAALFR